MQQLFSKLYAFVEHPTTTKVERVFHYTFLASMIFLAFVFLLARWLGIPILDYAGITLEYLRQSVWLIAIVVLFPELLSALTRYTRYRFRLAKGYWKGGRRDTYWGMVTLSLNTTLLVLTGFGLLFPPVIELWLPLLAVIYFMAAVGRGLYLLREPVEKLRTQINKKLPWGMIGEKKIEQLMRDA